MADTESTVTCASCAKALPRDEVVEIKGKFYCATCKEELVKDMQSGVDSTQLELATIGARFAAVLLDGLILLIPVMAIYFGMVFLLLGKFFITDGGFGIGLVVGLVASIPGLLYEGLMLQAGGQTIGKKAMKIKVVTPEGQDIAPGQAWSRTLVRLLFNQLQGLGIINYLFAFGKERTCLHDRMAKTRVVNWRR